MLRGFCGFAMVVAWVFQRRESADLDRLLRARRAAGESLPQSVSAATPKHAKRVLAASKDDLIGCLEIARLHKIAPISPPLRSCPT
jgi:hypothetical protein